MHYFKESNLDSLTWLYLERNVIFSCLHLYKDAIKKAGCKISRGCRINKSINFTLWYNNHNYWLNSQLVLINNMGACMTVASSASEALLYLYVLIIKEFLWQVNTISEYTVHVFGSPLQKAWKTYPSDLGEDFWKKGCWPPVCLLGGW